MTWLAGCKSLRPIEADSTPSLDALSSSLAVAEGEGIVVLHVETDVKIEKLLISGYEYRQTLLPGSHLVLLATPPGKLRMQRFFVGEYYYYELRKSSGFTSFEVRAGEISYPGMLLIRKAPDDLTDMLWLVIRSANRSMMARAEIERRYPGLLERMPIRYAGRGRDRFYEQLELAERRADCPTCGAETAP